MLPHSLTHLMSSATHDLGLGLLNRFPPTCGFCHLSGHKVARIKFGRIFSTSSSFCWIFNTPRFFSSECAWVKLHALNSNKSSSSNNTMPFRNWLSCSFLSINWKGQHLSTFQVTAFPRVNCKCLLVPSFSALSSVLPRGGLLRFQAKGEKSTARLSKH